jgi:hypothetical protein
MLKKCVVILVLFALVTGAVFAQVTFGGQLQEGITLLSGTNVKDDDVISGTGYYADGPFHEAKFSVLFGDGTAGGRLVMNVKGSYWGWMQWRANQYFRVKIGSDGDGEWGFPQIIGWGFTGEAKNSVAAVNDYDGSLLAMSYRNSGLNYGGYDGSGNFNLGLSVFPIDMLQVNFLFRGIANNNKGVELSERLAKMEISASYKLEEIGTVRFAAEGKGGLAKHVDDGGAVKDGDKVGVLHFAFYSNEIVQGLAFEAGAQFDLPHVNESDTFDAIRVGGGFNLTKTDPFNFKLRFGSMFGGQKQGEDLTASGLSFGFLPSYKLPKFTVFLHCGIGFSDDTAKDESKYEWFINPYIWVPIGGMRMWIGLQILDQHNDRKDDAAQFAWKVPFGFNFYF